MAEVEGKRGPRGPEVWSEPEPQLLTQNKLVRAGFADSRERGAGGVLQIGPRSKAGRTAPRASFSGLHDEPVWIWRFGVRTFLRLSAPRAQCA